MAYKVEAAVDLESGAVAGVEACLADTGDTALLAGTMDAANACLAAAVEGAEIEEAVCDKGYHSRAVLKELARRGVRGCVSEPGGRGLPADPEEKAAVEANRARIRSERGREAA